MAAAARLARHGKLATRFAASERLVSSVLFVPGFEASIPPFHLK